MVPEHFAPFFKHRSISTNSTGAVRTHLSMADAILDQKQPFYTTASFVLILVSLLRARLLFYPSDIRAWTLLKLSEELVIIFYLFIFFLPSTQLQVRQGARGARDGPKYKYNEAKMVLGIVEVTLSWYCLAELEFSCRPLSHSERSGGCKRREVLWRYASVQRVGERARFFIPAFTGWNG